MERGQIAFFSLIQVPAPCLGLKSFNARLLGTMLLPVCLVALAPMVGLVVVGLKARKQRAAGHGLDEASGQWKFVRYTADKVGTKQEVRRSTVAARAGQITGPQTRARRCALPSTRLSSTLACRSCSRRCSCAFQWYQASASARTFANVLQLVTLWGSGRVWRAYHRAGVVSSGTRRAALTT